jgi:hypothetical protein
MAMRLAVFSDPGGSSTAGQKIPERSKAWRKNDPIGNAQNSFFCKKQFLAGTVKIPKYFLYFSLVGVSKLKKIFP